MKFLFTFRKPSAISFLTFLLFEAMFKRLSHTRLVHMHFSDRTQSILEAVLDCLSLGYLRYLFLQDSPLKYTDYKYGLENEIIGKFSYEACS